MRTTDPELTWTETWGTGGPLCRIDPEKNRIKRWILLSSTYQIRDWTYNF
jgi:hypothetical protein